MSKTVCFDYDGVLDQPAGVEFARHLKAQGYTIFVYTARHDLHTVIQHLRHEEDVAVDEVFHKPTAKVYIDDNAIRHTSWPDTKTQLKEYYDIT